MKKNIMVLVGTFFWSLVGQGLDERRYNEVCFLTSHNSYAATKHGYAYAQQNLTIKEQLEMGVRGLMLDIVETRAKTILLCHKNESLTHILCNGKPPTPFSEALVCIKQFLDTNNDEIITIFLENYVKDKLLLDKEVKATGLDEYILTAADWNPDLHDGWPTISWMKKHNRRLLIFNSLGETIYTFNQWEYVAENQWGTLNKNKASKERKESSRWRAKTRYLYLVNYFPAFQLKFRNPYQQINTRDLDIFLQEISKGGLDKQYGAQRSPNFISVDFVDIGDAMKHVTAFNTLETDYKNAFRPLYYKKA